MFKVLEDLKLFCLVFRILELGDDGSGGMDCNTERTGCLFVEVDLPDESLLRSEFDQFSPYKKPDLFMRYDFNKTMQNVSLIYYQTFETSGKLDRTSYVNSLLCHEPCS